MSSLTDRLCTLTSCTRWVKRNGNHREINRLAKDAMVSVHVQFCADSTL